MDIVTYVLAKNSANSAIATAIAALPKGLIYRGAVSYVSDLPNNAEIGDCYTIKYKGTSGTTADGHEVAWGNYEGTPQWIDFGGGGSSITVDDVLSDSSENPVQNKVIAKDVGELKSALDTIVRSVMINDTASGSIASFPDGADGIPVKDLTVAVEPVQDLHGYNNPWPAGGGVNLLDPAKCSVVGPGGAYGLTVTHDQETETWTISGTPTSQTASLGFNFCTYSDFSLSGKGYQVQAFPISGTPIKNLYGFRDEAENRIAIIIDTVANPTVNMTFKVSVAVTAQTAWSPYSNICPISGWTGAKVTRTGKNLFDGTFIADTMIVDSTGEYYANEYHKCSNKILAKENTVYTLSGTDLHKRSGTATNAANVTIAYYKVDGTYIRREAPDTSTNTYKTFTTPANTAFVILQVGGQATNVMLEESATETTYEPFGTTYPISWQTEAGTVYGGTLDVTTGKLTVDRAMADLGAKNWYPSPAATSAGRTRFRASITDIERISSPNIVAPMLCSAYKTETANNTYTGKQGISLQQNAADVYVYDAQTESMTGEEFKSAMSGVQLVYKLATPIVYDLTPTEVATLLAQNNIWADCGDSTVNYRADTKLYIDKKIAALAAAMS